MSSPMDGAGELASAAIDLGKFVYEIIKDSGHELKFTSTVADKGLSTVPEGMPVTIVKRYEHGSAWYTHTRAWHAAIHSLYSHNKGESGKPGKDLSSTYLCIVFPFKVTYAVAEPDVATLKQQIAKIKVEINAEKEEAKKKLLEKLTAQRTKPSDSGPVAPKAPTAPTKPTAVDKPTKPTKPDEPEKPDGYRTPDERAAKRRTRDRKATSEEAAYEEDMEEYQANLKAYPANLKKYEEDLKKYEAYREERTKYQEAKAKYENAMEEYRLKLRQYDLEVATSKELQELVLDGAPDSDELIKANLALLQRKRDFLTKVETDKNVKYMTDVRIHPADGYNGLKSRAWQNVKVDAQMELSGNEPVEGQSTSVTVQLAWSERVPGYGKTWTGTITLRPGSQAVTGEGKFLERFKRYALLQEA